MTNPGTWEALAGLWPIEDRAEVYKNKAYVNSLSLDTLLKVQECYEKKARELHTGGRHQADQKPATIAFKAASDNCFDKLHEARFKLRMPLSPPEDWWPLMPLERTERFRGIDLRRAGAADQVNRSTINKLVIHYISNPNMPPPPHPM